MSARTRAPRAGLRLAALAFLAAFLGGCASDSPNYQGQSAFADPDAAVTALGAAAKASGPAQLSAIFGPEGQEVLSSGDPVADRRQRNVFTVAFDQGWSLERKDGSTRELIVGHEQWPFPIPLVQDSRGWWFDTVAGKQEVLARRIGRNELAAIGALRAYTLAQKQYAGVGHDGKPAGIYAQKLPSDPGKHNGLYWATTGTADTPSPLGAFVAAATAEGYGKQPKGSIAPYHGYYYRILTRQGPAAPGGAKNYVVSGDMTGGFAMIAYPAEYGNSGIMAFLVGPDGAVLESDLGAETPALAGAMERFNPASGWQPVD